MVIQARDRRLARQITIPGFSTRNQFENRIAPQCVVVILILVAGEYPEDPLSDHAQDGVLWIDSPIRDVRREVLRLAKFFVELGKQQQPPVRTQFLFDRLTKNLPLPPITAAKHCRRLYHHP